MGQPRAPLSVKLIVSAFAPGDELLTEAKQALISEWGHLDLESERLPFAHTTYYEAEFGAGLVRRIWSFEPLIDPGTMAAIKLRTNQLEEQWSEGGNRRVNLDPGYVSMAKLVLATTKNHGHRIYLGSGIYAEVTLSYRDGVYRPRPWTYPDYATPGYCALFGDIRQRYVAQLRQRPRKHTSSG